MVAYYGAIYKDDDSDYGIAFPDLPGCVSASSTLEELEPLAREGLALHIEGMREDGDELPKPRTFTEIFDEVGNHEGFQGISLISVPDKVKRVRVNVSLSEAELEIIDSAAASKHMDRSAFLAAAARAVASGECRI